MILDVDECESGTHYCHVDADCDNMPGTFNCVRRTGYPESESETRRIKREDVTGSGDNIDSGKHSIIFVYPDRNFVNFF